MFKHEYSYWEKYTICLYNNYLIFLKQLSEEKHYCQISAFMFPAWLQCNHPMLGNTAGRNENTRFSL